nr:hypothetical protein [Agrobacterium cavarae]
MRQPVQRRPHLGHGVRDIVRDASAEVQGLEDLSEVHTNAIDLGNGPVVGRGTGGRDPDPEHRTPRELRNRQSSTRGLRLDVSALGGCKADPRQTFRALLVKRLAGPTPCASGLWPLSQSPLPWGSGLRPDKRFWVPKT